MKRIFSLALTLAMVLSIAAGCSSGSNSTPGTSTPSSTPSTSDPNTSSTVHHTGRGKQADVHVKQAVQRDLTPLVRQNVRPQLAGADHKKSGAICASVVQHGALFHRAPHDTGSQLLLLGSGQLVPRRKILRKFHFYPSRCGVFLFKISITVFSPSVKPVIDICHKQAV